MDQDHEYFLLPKPKRLESTISILGDYSKYFVNGVSLEDMLKDEHDFKLDEEIEEVYVKSSFWDWVPLTKMVTHEFMPFYHTILIINANPDSCEYKNVALMHVKEGNGFVITKIYDNIDDFLEEFDKYEKNKPELNEEYEKMVKENVNLCNTKVWINHIRSSFGNYLLSKYKMHEDEYDAD